MFALILLTLLSSAQADSVTVGPQLEWWPGAARHHVGPGTTLQYHHQHSWWGVDAELSLATGLERSVSARFTHQFIRSAVLWSIEQGHDAIRFQAGIGLALTVHLSQMDGGQFSTATQSVQPGARARMGVGGVAKRLVWSWHLGATTVDWPRAHFDTGFALGVGW